MSLAVPIFSGLWSGLNPKLEMVAKEPLEPPKMYSLSGRSEDRINTDIPKDLHRKGLVAFLEAPDLWMALGGLPKNLPNVQL